MRSHWERETPERPSWLPLLRLHCSACYVPAHRLGVDPMVALGYESSVAQMTDNIPQNSLA